MSDADLIEHHRAELARLHAIENAGLRVVSSQGSRGSDLVITVDVKALRRLEAALEARS